MKSYYQINDDIIKRIAALPISNRCKMELIGLLTSLQTRYELDLKRTEEEKVSLNVYDEEEIYENCTVQVLRNSITGDVSVGWWQDEPEEVEE